MLKKVMPRAQRCARMRSAMNDFCMSFSLTESSSAIKITVLQNLFKARCNADHLLK